MEGNETLLIVEPSRWNGLPRAVPNHSIASSHPSC